MQDELLKKIDALVMDLIEKEESKHIQSSIKAVQKALDSEEKTAFSLDEMDTIKGVLLPNLTTYSSKNNNALADSIQLLNNFIEDTEGYVILNGLTSNFERTKVAQPAGAYYTYVTKLQEIINDKDKGNLETSNLAADKKAELFEGDLNPSIKLIKEIIETEAVKSSPIATQYYTDCNGYNELAQNIRQVIEDVLASPLGLKREKLLSTSNWTQRKALLNNITHLTSTLENDKKSLIQTLDQLIQQKEEEAKRKEEEAKRKEEEAKRKEEDEAKRKEEGAKRQQEAKRNAKVVLKQKVNTKVKKIIFELDEAWGKPSNYKENFDLILSAADNLDKFNDENKTRIKESIIQLINSTAENARTNKSPDFWSSKNQIDFKHTISDIVDVFFQKTPFKVKAVGLSEDFFKVENVEKILPCFEVIPKHYLSCVIKRAMLEDAFALREVLTKGPDLDIRKLQLNDLMRKFSTENLSQPRDNPSRQELMSTLDYFFQEAIAVTLQQDENNLSGSFYLLMLLLFKGYGDAYKVLSRQTYNASNLYKPEDEQHVLYAKSKKSANIHNDAQLFFSIFKLMHISKQNLDTTIYNNISTVTHFIGPSTDIKKQLRLRFKRLTKGLHRANRHPEVNFTSSAIKELDRLAKQLHQVFGAGVDAFNKDRKNGQVNAFSATLRDTHTSGKLKEIRKHDYPNLFKEDKALPKGRNLAKKHMPDVRKK